MLAHVVSPVKRFCKLFRQRNLLSVRKGISPVISVSFATSASLQVLSVLASPSSTFPTSPNSTMPTIDAHQQ